MVKILNYLKSSRKKLFKGFKEKNYISAFLKDEFHFIIDNTSKKPDWEQIWYKVWQFVMFLPC